MLARLCKVQETHSRSFFNMLNNMCSMVMLNRRLGKHLDAIDRPRTTRRPPWPPVCGAPPRRLWPAPVGCVQAAQPIHSVAGAATGAAAESGRKRPSEAKPTTPCRGCSLQARCACPARAQHTPRGTHARTLIPCTPFSAQPTSAHLFTRLTMPPLVFLLAVSRPHGSNGALLFRVHRASSTSRSCRRSRRRPRTTFSTSSGASGARTRAR